jgi:hypothetical protein
VRWLAAALVSISTALASAALAEPSRVVLLEPAAQTAGVLREAMERTKAELQAAGFDVVVRPLADGPNLRPALETAAHESQAFAAVAVSLSAGSASADVWVTDRITGKTVIRTVDVRDVAPEARASALAIRAVELLRASLVEAIRPGVSEEPAPELPPDVSEWMTPEPDPPLAGFAVEIGGALLHGFDDMGTAGSPILRLSYGADIGLAGRLTLAGPAFGPNPRGPYGSASVRQEMATLELVYVPCVDWLGFEPVLSAGAGVYHLHARGDLTPPFEGQSDDVWSVAIRAGAGLGYRVHPDVMALLDAELVLALPRAVVTMAGEPIASAGLPSLSSSLGVVVRF